MQYRPRAATTAINTTSTREEGRQCANEYTRRAVIPAAAPRTRGSAGTGPRTHASMAADRCAASRPASASA